MDTTEKLRVGELRVGGLIPAAGASRRLGRDKRLLSIGKRTVIETTFAALQAAAIAPIAVVLESDSPCSKLSGLRQAQLLENPAPERGMLSSVRIGLSWLAERCDAVAVLPGDHVFVPSSAIVEVVAHFHQTRPPLLRPRYCGRGGHPLLISAELFAAAQACDDSVGLRQLLQTHRCAELALDIPEALWDIDTPDDLVRLRKLVDDR
ncbi:MAG: nucleotidyltransferase family protein [Deltaproteobacteria bacterium]|nr:nucleotidyltransferase family protein [Deltaproteobacteria bacterium]